MSAKRIAVTGATGRLGSHLVDVLEERGHETVRISRANDVDVVTGKGLDRALVGVEAIVDLATGPSPDYEEATAFFRASAANLHRAGSQAGVQRLIPVSIVGTDAFTDGYGLAKLDQERAVLAGPIPARIVRATQFHEFVGQLVDWGRQGDVAYVSKMRTQPVAARSLAEVVADVVLDPESTAPGLPHLDVAGPQEENLVDLAIALMAKRGDPTQIVGVTGPDDPYSSVHDSGALLPGPDAVIAGPTFEEWLEAGERVA